MKSFAQQFAGRQRIVRWVVTDNGPVQAEGYYCCNGPEIDGRWNRLDSDGNEAPGPENTSPMYFFPELGSSRGLGGMFHYERDADMAYLADCSRRLTAAQDAYETAMDKASAAMDKASAHIRKAHQ